MVPSSPAQRTHMTNELETDQVESRLDEGLTLAEMLCDLELAAGASSQSTSVVDPDTDQALAERRLGNAAGLYVALRCKHAQTATHCLHVALLCSAWAKKMSLDEEQRIQLEVAALLHDVGIIGIPDRILYKPTYLESHEISVMAHACRLSQEILAANGASVSLLAIVKNIRTWYNTSTEESAETETPLESRMIAIAEAFDSMTTDHVFRSARSKEQAVHELMRCAGTQFDPALVDQFVDISKQDLSQLCRQRASHWLQDMESHMPLMFGGAESTLRPKQQSGITPRFLAKILESMRDGVIMVDPALKVIGWNHRAEEMTGHMADSLSGETWQPEILEMWDDKERAVSSDRCPLRHAVTTGRQVSGRYSLVPRNGGPIVVVAQVIPVHDQESVVLGAAMIIRDISSERSLERLCENLHSKATHDPLTRIPNRSEFNRVYADLIRKYQQNSTPFSLMICDLDHFKQINDAYGHQVGDEVLVKTAGILKESSRSKDLVARYGGEEFVIVCPDCGVAAATRRAEQVRDRISRAEHPMLGKQRVTVSVGVTQTQPGDTVEAMLRRADRALYAAKDQGRNCVVQLGAGDSEEEVARCWAFWRRKRKTSPKIIAEELMVTPGPIAFVLEKLRGYVVDHRAVIRGTDENVLELGVKAAVYNPRRNTETRYVFLVSLAFSEEPSSDARNSKNAPSQIRIRVSVSLNRGSARKSTLLTDGARQVAQGVRAYLMAKSVAVPDEDEEDDSGSKIMLPTLNTPR